MNKEFNEVLGNLFYAIATADKKVHEKERAKLTQILRAKWVSSPMNNSSQQIENVFDELVDRGFSASQSLRLFKNYLSKHPEEFGMEICLHVWSTALAIASAFARKNKSELIILNNLRNILLNEKTALERFLTW